MMTSAFAQIFNDENGNGESWLRKAVDSLTVSGKMIQAAELDYMQAHPIEAAGFALSAVPGGEGVGEDIVARGIDEGGELPLSNHALTRMDQRGITKDEVDNTIQNGESFKYYHESEWKTGYYDSNSRIFVAQGESGQIVTVINNVRLNYISNLRGLKP